MRERTGNLKSHNKPTEFSDVLLSDPIGNGTSQLLEELRREADVLAECKIGELRSKQKSASPETDLLERGYSPEEAEKEVLHTTVIPERQVSTYACSYEPKSLTLS